MDWTSLIGSTVVAAIIVAIMTERRLRVDTRIAERRFALDRELAEQVGPWPTIDPLSTGNSKPWLRSDRSAMQIIGCLLPMTLTVVGAAVGGVTGGTAAGLWGAAAGFAGGFVSMLGVIWLFDRAKDELRE